MPTGSTLLNMVCSGNPFGGYVKGTMVNMIGDSSAGKTMLFLTMCAEAVLRPWLARHLIKLDDAEAANLFDIPTLFGDALAQRLDSVGALGCSDSVEDFYRNVANLLEESNPFIYGLDSMDALETAAGRKRFEVQRAKANEAEEEGEQAEEGKGSYGDGKAKFNSEGLRLVCRTIKRTDSLLFIISQTRDNITSRFAPRTRSGGRALKFYASHEIWLAVDSAITKSVNGRKRLIGHNIKAKVSKNKTTGSYDIVSFPILFNYGVDDIMSCINYLCDEGAWKRHKGELYTAPQFFEGQVQGAALVKVFDEEADALRELRLLVAATWLDIQAKLQPNRVRRFG